MKKILFLIMGLGLYTGANAQLQLETYKCPKTSEEVNNLLTAVTEMKEAITAQMGCKEVEVNLNSVVGLMQDTRYKDILDLLNKGGTELEAEQADMVSNYAEELTSTIGAVIAGVSSGDAGFWSGFFGGNDLSCKLSRKTEMDVIENMALIANNVSDVVSQFMGPYGVPLQVGTRAMQGVIAGLKNFSSYGEKIDFDDFKKRKFFETTVCQLEKLESDIKQLAHPERYLRDLRAGQTAAYNQLKELLVERCKECEILLSNISEVQMNKYIERLPLELRGYADETLMLKKNIEWIDEKVEGFSTHAQRMQSGGYGIGLRELEMNADIIRDYLTKTAAPSFLKWYVRATQEDNYVLRTEMRDTYGIMHERARKLGVEVDTSLTPEIEDQFNFTSEQGVSYTTPMIANQSYSYMTEAIEIGFAYLIKKNVDKFDEDPRLHSSIMSSYKKWNVYDLTVAVIAQYCEYYTGVLQYSDQIADICEGRKYTWERLKSAYLSFYFADIMNNSALIAELGPYDFRLTNGYAFIKENNERIEMGVLKLADTGVNLEAVLRTDNAMRQSFGLEPNKKDTSFLNDSMSIRERMQKAVAEELARISSMQVVPVTEE